eukprot:5152798-Prymnesium_polylepis.1
MLLSSAQQHSSGKVASFFLRPISANASTIGLEVGISGRWSGRVAANAQREVSWVGDTFFVTVSYATTKNIKQNQKLCCDFETFP